MLTGGNSQGGSYPLRRFKQSAQGREIESAYDISSDSIQDIVERNIRPFFIFRTSLTTASSDPASGITPPTAGEWIELKQAGNHIALFGYDRSTTNQSVITNAFVEVFIGSQRPNNDDVGFPLKHNRGLSGPFDRVFVRWPAQTTSANTSANIVIYRYQYRPWINGEAAT